MLAWEQMASGEYRGLVRDRKEITLPFMIGRGSWMLNGSSSEFSKIALRRGESASPRISIEWGYVMPIKEVNPSCNHRVLAEFAIDALRSS